MEFRGCYIGISWFNDFDLNFFLREIIISSFQKDQVQSQKDQLQSHLVNLKMENGRLKNLLSVANHNYNVLRTAYDTLMKQQNAKAKQENEVKI